MSVFRDKIGEFLLPWSALFACNRDDRYGKLSFPHLINQYRFKAYIIQVIIKRMPLIFMFLFILTLNSSCLNDQKPDEKIIDNLYNGE
jgi:hypothetical protein